MLERDYDFSILENFRKRYIERESNSYTDELTRFIMQLMNEEYEENIESREVKEEVNV